MLTSKPYLRHDSKSLVGIKLLIELLLQGSYRETGMGDRKIAARGELCVFSHKIL